MKQFFQKFGLIRSLHVLLIGLGCGLVLPASASADLSGIETGLNPAGAAYEINADDQGWLWISDYDAKQVWGIDPTGENYQVYSYPGLGSPSDARRDGDWLWWVEGSSNFISRISTNDGAFTRWQVSGATRFYGSAVDSEGRLWATSRSSSLLYNIDPELGVQCSFLLPEGGMSYYALHHNGELWLGERTNGRLLRLTIQEDELGKLDDSPLNWWDLSEDSTPQGLVFDGDGKLWFTDTGIRRIGVLDPDGGVDGYPLPNAMLPGMIAILDDRVWFSEQGIGGIGQLDPSAAVPASIPYTTGSMTLSPDCVEISASSIGTINITAGETQWETQNYTPVWDSEGWRIFQLPEGSNPWGIASTGSVWFVDTERQVLGKINPIKIFLPIIIH